MYTMDFKGAEVDIWKNKKEKHCFHVPQDASAYSGHGLLFDPIKFILVFMKHPCKWPAIYLIAASLLLALPAVFIERYFKKQNIPAIAPGRMKGQSEQITYPVTLKVKGLCYFLLAPTLHYHLNFLRNSHCRHSYIIKRLLEVECRLTLVVVVQVGYPSPQMARQSSSAKTRCIVPAGHPARRAVTRTPESGP
ncbi:diacylglycerol O-acyltransferase 1-like [Morphnus guianensis]